MIVIYDPSSDNIEITFNNINNTPFSIYMIDITGKIVLNEEKTISEADNRLIINTHNISAGLYNVVIQSDDILITKRIIIP